MGWPVLGWTSLTHSAAAPYPTEKQGHDSMTGAMKSSRRTILQELIKVFCLVLCGYWLYRLGNQAPPLPLMNCLIAVALIFAFARLVVLADTQMRQFLLRRTRVNS